MSKAKYILQHCVSCNREAKMEIRAVEGSETQFWYRCTRCHHSMMIDRSVQISEPVAKPTRDTCIAYTPANIYEVGSSIYHSDWDDMGMVTSKERTSSGGNAIWVSFEKNGSRRLIENLQED